VRPPKVVALGGGHGLAASLSALRRVTRDITAVVTVADDGGSSGRLREELGVLPPGDLRMALAALAGDDVDSEIGARLLQHRFAGTGPLSGHAVGNLLLVGLTEVLGDPVSALDALGRVLGACGRVLPVSPQPMDIAADVSGLDPDDPGAVVEVRGQVAVATTPGRLVSLRLVPAEPTACDAAVTAILDADWVVIGPGSWFTSVLPHLMVPGVNKALCATAARRLVVLNLAPQQGETSGFSPETHLEVFAAHAPELTLDVVLADPATVTDVAALRSAVESAGGRLVLAEVGVADGSPRHDPARLARAYGRIFDSEGPWQR
jgi:uncharacterized cofD-like protein